jgi:hypothetical protein
MPMFGASQAVERISGAAQFMTRHATAAIPHSNCNRRRTRQTALSVRRRCRVAVLGSESADGCGGARRSSGGGFAVAAALQRSSRFLIQ